MPEHVTKIGDVVVRLSSLLPDAKLLLYGPDGQAEVAMRDLVSFIMTRFSDVMDADLQTRTRPLTGHIAFQSDFGDRIAFTLDPKTLSIAVHEAEPSIIRTPGDGVFVIGREALGITVLEILARKGLL